MQNNQIERSIRQDISGEVFRVVNKSVTKIWPSVDLGSLITVERNNSICFLHPQSRVLVASYEKHAASIKPDKGREAKEGYAGRPQKPCHRINIKRPRRFSYKVYSPVGDVVSVIEGRYAEFDNISRMPYVTTISDYGPANTRPYKEHENRDKIITTNRDDARKNKQLLRKFDPSSLTSYFSEANGFVTRSTISRAAAAKTAKTARKQFEKNDCALAYAASPAPKGKLRRERSFREIDHAKTIFFAMPGQFSYLARRQKDRVNFANGEYTVTQYAEGGGSYSIASFDIHGRRKKLTSYDAQGNSVKELGPEKSTAMPLSLKTRQSRPLAKVLKQRLQIVAQLSDVTVDTMPEPAENPTLRNGLNKMRFWYRPRRPPVSDNWTNYPTIPAIEP